MLFHCKYVYVNAAQYYPVRILPRLFFYIASISKWYHQQQGVRNLPSSFPCSNFVHCDGRNVFVY